MAGAGYKLFNTGDVLTAAQVNEYLMQQTVMVFANASARTTALSGVLAEGMLSYLKDTNKVYVYDGSAWLDVSSEIPSQTGNSGKYLTTDGTNASWGTISAGGMTLINTGGTALSGASTTISSIPATYYNLFVVVQGFKTSYDGDVLIGRFNSDSNTRYSALGYTQQNNQSFGSTYLEFSNAQDNSVATNLSYFTIPDYANTTTWKMLQGFSIQVNATTTTNFNILPLSSFYNQTAAISSIEFIGLNANFTGGTVYVYGVK